MRGNENLGSIFAAIGEGEFQIPMRGNERIQLRVPAAELLVSNPHEG